MDRAEAMRVAASDATVSDKIRALDAAGFPRAEIARLLGKRYQHVRNVLEMDKLHPPAGRPAASGLAEPGRRFQGPTPQLPPQVEDRGGGVYRLRVMEDGSVVLPASVREAFGVTGGGAVMARLEGEDFKLYSGATAWRRIDEKMRPYRWTGGPLASEELIAERRAETTRDADG